MGAGVRVIEATHVGSVEAPDSYTITLPSTILNNDLIVLLVGAFQGAAGPFPADFTTVYSQNSGGGNWCWDACAWKLATPGDADRVITYSGGGPYPNYSQFVATVLRGVKVRAAAGMAYPSNGPGTGPITVTTTVRRLVCYVDMQNGIAPTSLPTPAGYTPLYRGQGGVGWQNSGVYLANADEAPGVLPSVASGWGGASASGISIALTAAGLELEVAGSSAVSAPLSGGTIYPEATAVGTSDAIGGLFRPIPNARGGSGPIHLAAGGEFRRGTLRPPVTVGLGELHPVSTGGGGDPTGPTPPPTTGQIWPRGNM